MASERVASEGAGQPVLIVVAGPDGSGKTSLARQMRLSRWVSAGPYIAAESIARERFGAWDDPQARALAVREAEAERAGYLEQRVSFGFETLLSTPDKVDFLRRAKDAGYFVRLFFIGTEDPSINVRRVAARVSQGGDAVAEEKIRHRYYRSQANLIEAAGWADRSYVFDNSVDDAPAALMFRLHGGRIEASYTERAVFWARLVMFQRLIGLCS